MPVIDTSTTTYTRSLREEDVEWVLDLWERRYGYPSPNIVEAAVDDDREHVAGFVGMVGSSRAGFGLCYYHTVETIENDLEVAIEPYASHKLNGLLYQLCVEQEHENRGIGTMLTRERLNFLRSSDPTLYQVFALSWVRDDHVDSRVTLEKLDFEPIELYDNFYPDDRPCPACEVGCECDAELYALQLRI